MSILGSMTEALNKKQPRAPTISQTPPQDNSQTMAGNVANILNSNSLLMRSAAAKGERIAANRGLQNSTAGAEAAQRAMLDAAMPIASQDTQNAFAEKQTRLQADLTYQNQSKLNQQQNQFTAEQAGLDRTHQRDLANINHTNNMQRLNAEVSANTIGKSIDFAQQITNNFDAQIAAVLNNTSMKEEDKKKAINMLKESRDSEMNFMSRFMQGIPTTRQNWSSFPNLGVPNVGVY